MLIELAGIVDGESCSPAHRFGSCRRAVLDFDFFARLEIKELPYHLRGVRRGGLRAAFGMLLSRSVNAGYCRTCPTAHVLGSFLRPSSRLTTSMPFCSPAKVSNGEAPLPPAEPAAECRQRLERPPYLAPAGAARSVAVPRARRWDLRQMVWFDHCRCPVAGGSNGGKAAAGTGC